MNVRRDHQRGQSLTELALFLPIMLVLLLGIGDLARGFASMITIESAAREAADWGAYRPGNWDTVAPQYPTTVAEMERRACTAALNLPDFEPAGGDGSTCTNPTFECSIGLGNPSAACSNPSTCDVDPCKVEVKLTYVFRLISPSSLLALPDTFTFVRTSTFAVGRDPGTQ